MTIMRDAEAMLLQGHNRIVQRQSCTVVVRETVLFLGGIIQANQISSLTPLGLMRIGTLPFFFTKGTCLVIGRQLYFGFGFDAESFDRCWSR